ncbi:MAG: FtsQ-type POTRA domain-containing protein [Acidobacteriaceae bacterium]
MEQCYRPAAASTTRAKIAQESVPERSGVRRLAEQASGEGLDREEEAFLRARRRVPVRRGLIPTSRVGRITAAAAVVLSIAALVLLLIGVRNFFRDDPRFRIGSASSIQIMGNSQVTRPELLSVFGSDLGRNIFFIPLRARRASLEQLPWVEHATVMRLLPDQLRVAIVERTPVAFVRHGNTIGLVDAHGVLLQLPPAAMAAKHYSFPVVSGISDKDPLSARAARMHLYQQFIHDLDSGGAKVSNQLSEVDISDPEDVWALLPAQGSDIQVHFGDSDFLARYRSYQQHLLEWRQQYPHLASVDMRYENQVVLDMAQQTNTDSGQDGAAVRPHHGDASETKHAGHTAQKPAAKSLKAGRAKG